MSFTARVKETGKIFEATAESDETGIRVFDAHSLQDGRFYRGYLYDTEPTNDPTKFRYTNRTAATFRAIELERLPLPVTLRGVRNSPILDDEVDDYVDDTAPGGKSRDHLLKI